MSQPSDPSHSDPFAPPKTPCEVQCVHCGESYESWRIEWRETTGESSDDAGLPGTWCCPTPGCDGIGFGFDIFPVDPQWTDERGEPMMAFLEDEDEDEDELSLNDDDEPATVGFGMSDEDDDEDMHDGMPIDAFDADAFWLDVDALLPPPLGNTPQPPFDAMSPSNKPWSSLGHDDIPF